MMHLTEDERNLFETFAPYIQALPDRPRLTKDDLLTAAFRLHQVKGLAVYYAPFDYVNKDAKVAIVGITPGWAQMEIAYRSARDDLHAGLAHDGVLRRAKQKASFAGSMRTNLISMLDDLGLPERLGIGSTESLFGEHHRLVHTTSAVRYPVFVKGHNYAGHSPKLLKTEVLRYFVENVLAEELGSVGVTLVIPLGKSVSEALEHLAASDRLDRERCLMGFPHPSGANGHRAREFLERRQHLRRQLRRWAE